MLHSSNLHARFIEALEHTPTQAHLCLSYLSPAEQGAAVGPFIHSGLARREKCLCLLDRGQSEDMYQALQLAGVEVEKARRAGALRVLGQTDLPYQHGIFAADIMLAFLAEASQAAKVEGFTALRVTMDLTWCFDGRVDPQRVIEFEAHLNNFLVQHGITSLCQYSRQQTPPEPMLAVLRTHPLIISDNLVCQNFYYIPPHEFFKPNRATFDLEQLLANIQAHEWTEEILQQRNRDLTLLNRASQVFISTLDLDRVLTVILAEVRHVLGVLACSAWLIDPATEELVCRQATDPQGEVIRGWRLAPGQGLAGWVVQHGQSLIIPDVQHETRHFKGIDQQTGLALRSILTVPLWVRQKVIGVLQVVDAQVNRFDETDLTLLESLAVTAAIAIENARLYEQVRQDADAKATLLHEVNHRVKNNLAAIVGLLYAERQHANIEDQPVYQIILTDLINRVQGLATVHNMLSASGWTPLELSELARQVIRSAAQALPWDKHLSVNISPSQVKVTPEQARNLALIINELTTNTIRHAMTEHNEAQITVSITEEQDLICFEFRDNGPGYPEPVLRAEQHEAGFELIGALAQKSLHGELHFYNDGGAVAVLRCKAIR